MDSIDCIVIGAGVVGLAVARALALSGREVFVVERNAAIGMETSSRNSEVIHAGLYYPTHSLKASLCVSGRDALYRYLQDRAIPHRRCGKLVVATLAQQQPSLAAIHAQAQANGCHEVSLLSADEARAREPALACTSALWSPNTGIIDSHAYMTALQGDAENAGAQFAFATLITGGETTPEGIVLRMRTDDGDAEVLVRTVINCAGLWAPRLAAAITGLDDGTVPRGYLAKGNYYSLAAKAPFSHLIYPVPEAGGLGVHLTLDLGGQARFGPDVEWLDTDPDAIDYQVDPQRAQAFYSEIRRYWPALPDGALQPAYSGVRPKISSPAEPAADFLFASHAHPGYLGLYGMESPGLTASLAIADHVVKRLTP
ncbi:NAD(P)/FAD-dependent oxidoreductase [Noviherbaspirillum aridicola]|uniref:FAD dependent oxidoreductase domain-containing protein n=1 Tax=Noviherbaspirillum aridicola TaxID=2849687 RepID=A0ABQ4Q305_9BURK|nr:NAD(P)/FAD-dependent oxidoreductase [Noviherbaspirillum aridicola]GIZ51524.1 hypothetical protein NCCP691_15380 [Noviherbaspirillum aridicola]